MTPDMEINGVANAIARLEGARTDADITAALEELYMFCRYVRAKADGFSGYWHDFKKADKWDAIAELHL